MSSPPADSSKRRDFPDGVGLAAAAGSRWMTDCRRSRTSAQMLSRCSAVGPAPDQRGRQSMTDPASTLRSAPHSPESRCAASRSRARPRHVDEGTRRIVSWQPVYGPQDAHGPLARIVHGKHSVRDLKMGCRPRVPQPALRVGRQAGGGADPQHVVQLAFYLRPPFGAMRRRLAKHIHGWRRVVITLIPGAHKLARPGTAGQGLDDGLEFGRGDNRGSGAPAIPVSHQRKKVRARRPAVAPGDLIKADLHCAVIPTRLRGHSPAQIDRLKAGTPLQAKLRQGRKDLFVERQTLGFHILERRANEQPEYRIPFHNSPAPPMAAALSKVRPSCGCPLVTPFHYPERSRGVSSPSRRYPRPLRR